MKLVFIENNRPVTDSLTVAETFDKEHARVLRDIRELGCSEEFRVGNFAESTYINGQGREMPRAIMTEQGFSLLAMGYTGIKAMEFKEKYISQFHDMRNQIMAQLNTQFKLPQSFSESLRMLAAEIEEKEAVKAEKILLENRIQSDKPKVQFADTCMTSDKSILVREVAKLASKQGVMIGERRLFQKLRDWGMFVQHRNEPTQRAMEMGLFEIKKGVYAHPDGARDYATPKVTVKGQMYIINRLLKDAA